MNKKTLKKVIMRGGLATISLSLALVGAYMLTPSKTRVVNLGGNSYVKPQDDDQETYFSAFVNRLKDASDADSEETIPGLKASFEGFELTWGGLQEGTSTVKNDIKIGGDIYFSMDCIDNIKFTADLDVNYNGKNLDLALGYVESDFYLAVKDFRIKNTSVDRETLVDTIRELFFDPENEEGLGVYVNPGDLFNGFLASDTVTNLINSLGAKDEESEFIYKTNFTIDETANEAGTVITTEPVIGRTVKQGTTITLVVSKESGKVTIKDYKGQSYKTVEVNLKNAGLNVVLETQSIPKSEQSKYKENTVVDQSVPAGTKLAQGDTIAIYYAVFTIEYPDFTAGNYSVSDVQAYCKKYGVNVSVVYEESTQPAGTILKQNRTGEVISDQTLTITVAKNSATE